MSKRNITWLIVVIAVGVLAWLTFGWIVGLIAIGVTLAASEVVERRARRIRRAARESA